MMAKSEEKYMQMAIKEAKKALREGSRWPFGAVIVKGNKVIITCHNTVHSSKDPTDHAEINAIREACRKLNSKDLSGCTLYATCEPCPMCFTAAWWANISEIVYGTSLKDASSLGREMLVSSKFLNKKGGSKIRIRGGLLRGECIKLYEK